MPTVKIEQLNMEVMVENHPTVKVKQLHVEAFTSTLPFVKVKQFHIETMVSTLPLVKVKQLHAEVMEKTTTTVKVKQIHVEVMVKYYPPDPAPDLEFGAKTNTTVDVIIPAYAPHTLSYNLYWSPDGGGIPSGYVLAYTNVIPGNTYTVDVGTNGTYWFSLVSFNVRYERHNPGLMSNTLQPPLVPASFRVIGVNSRINITWREQENTTVSIYRKKTLGATEAHLMASGVTGQRFYDFDVDAGTEYFYYLVASNEIGDSAATAIKSGIPLPPGANRVVQRGRFGIFPPDDFVAPTVTTPPANYWQIVLNDTIIASKASPHGWDVIYTGVDFEVYAPGDSRIGDGYEVFYDDGS